MDMIPFVWGQAEVGGGAEELPSTGNAEPHWEDALNHCSRGTLTISSLPAVPINSDEMVLPFRRTCPPLRAT